MNPAFTGLSGNFPAGRGRIFSHGKFGLNRNILGMLCLVFLGVFALAGAPGAHHIIMLDTSGSMSNALKGDVLPGPGEKARIDAIREPFKDHIDDLLVGDTLHLYEFNQGLLNRKTITIVKEGDRAEAKLWVDNIKIISSIKTDDKGNRVQIGKATFLYSSLDEVLGHAEVLLKKHGRPPSLLIISDGKDTEKDGQFRDMAAVLKKHNATFKKLPSKIFCAIVEFNLGPIREAFVEGGGTVAVAVKDGDDPGAAPTLEKIFKLINIVADFATSLPGREAFIGQTISFTNRTQTNPPKKLSHLKPDKLQYEWDFGDGSAKSKGQNARHYYRKTGTYIVTLKAVNPESHINIATKTLELTIKPIVPKIQSGKRNAYWKHPGVYMEKQFARTKILEALIASRTDDLDEYQESR